MIRHPARFALLLVAGGGALLLAHLALGLPAQLTSSGGLALVGGLLAAYTLLTLGVWLLLIPRFVPRAAPLTPPLPPRDEPLTSADHCSADPVLAATVRAFDDWLDATRAAPAAPAVWSAFDQFVREQVGVHLGGRRIRCFHVHAAAATLTGLTPRTGNTADQPAARRGILGHVATTGRPFHAHDPDVGDSLQQLARDADEQWTLAWPVRRAGNTIGLIAAGELDASPAPAALRQPLLELLAQCWALVSYRAEATHAQVTDKTTGVLTREDFFAVGTERLAVPANEHEPVVVAVLALEGLRALDDAGLWTTRTALIERIGRALAARMRSDDVVGRFADDRFTLLLRRLDSSLGRVIAQKHLAALETLLAEDPQWQACVRLRFGLAGSGFAPAALETLLARAFQAVEQARKRDERVVTDVDPAPDVTAGAQP
jgi:GGDEF domain-containing protein